MPGGVVAHYVHMSPAPGLGRMAALVGLSCDGGQLTGDQQAQLQALGHQLAMHTVAARPMCAAARLGPPACLAARLA